MRIYSMIKGVVCAGAIAGFIAGFGLGAVSSAEAANFGGVKKYHFTVNATPSDARIRIMNIGPKYRPGILLAAGRYDVEVSKPGFVTDRRWVRHNAFDGSVDIKLKPSRNF